MVSIPDKSREYKNVKKLWANALGKVGWIYNVILQAEMEKKTGIILKTFFPKKMKMVLLDEQMGKIEGVPPSDQFACGALLTYYAHQRGKIYFLHRIDLIDMPLTLAKDDILFLHHVLEICYFCAPFGNRS